jgi:hypothetical protein
MKTDTFKFLFMVLLSVVLVSCSTSTSTSKLISIESYTFARTGDNGQLIRVESPAVFKKGEDVHLVLLNVGPFKKDDAGLNWFDMDLEVTDPDGKVLLSQTRMLGEAGHSALENNYAASPYGTCTNTTDLAAGEYKFKLIIYDKVGSGKATQTATFNLE